MDRRVLRAAFASSLPVLMGYVTMGIAAGVLLAVDTNVGAAPLWGFLTSALAISGTLQFVFVDWVKNTPPLLDVALVTLCINFRYCLYGFSMLDRFRGLPWWKKAYLIWTLTDETYALEIANNVPPGGDSTTYCLEVASFDHLYWIVGVLAGTVFGASIKFDCGGIEFAMTALFLVILADQCRERSAILPASIGLCAALVSRCFFPVAKMLIPSIAIMLVAMACMRRLLEAPADREADGAGEGDAR